MRTPLLAPPLPSNVDTNSEQFRKNRDDVLEQLAVIEELLAEAQAGGGGKGMRIVERAEDLAAAVAAARPRAPSATTGCSSSATSPAPATSRSRSSATSTANR